MKAHVLIKTGSADLAFALQEVPKPTLTTPTQVLIKVQAFGLNFADVMARLGLYRDAPPLPAIIGYDVVGYVEAVGAQVKHVEVGDRVTALTRFGGYAEYAVTEAAGVAKIPEDMPNGVATALTTQYGTAYYCAEEMVRLFPEDHVLIHAAAGGVGTALVQLARHKGCTIYGTAGSDNKLDYLTQLGVHHPINYRKHDFAEEIKKLRGKDGLDVIFDPIGGSSVKTGVGLLAPAGRIVCFGASAATAKRILNLPRLLFEFGFYNPAFLLAQSRSILNVNMLRIADHRPHVLQRCLSAVVRLTTEGVLAPTVGGTFPAKDISEAHAFLESRKSIGKIVVEW